MDTQTENNTAQAQVPPATEQTVKAVGKKTKGTGDVILDTAQEIENLTKTKALNLADSLVEDIDSNSFKLGGVLKVIHQNAWFEGFESFEAFVASKYGFQARKARYLMDIYDQLVTKQIPWEKVSGLGWSKLKDLAKVLTPENVDEWVAKASKLTVLELQALLKGSTEEGGEAKTTSDTTTLKFKVHNDQLETVQSALSKAKAETGTEHDNVALEMICTGYLGGSVAIASGVTLADQMKAIGWEKALETFGELFPSVDLVVSLKEESAAQ